MHYKSIDELPEQHREAVKALVEQETRLDRDDLQDRVDEALNAINAAMEPGPTIQEQAANGVKKILSQSRGKPERDLQAACVEWAAWNESQYPELRAAFAIANEATRDRPHPGIRPGVWDYCIPTATGCLWVEFKSPNGKLTKAQMTWFETVDQLYANGHHFVIVKSLDDFIHFVESYLGKKRNCT